MTGDGNNRFRPFPAALWQTVIIVLFGSAIGLAVNGVRENGIPLVGSIRVVKFDQPLVSAPVERPAMVQPRAAAENELLDQDEAPEAAAPATTDLDPEPVKPATVAELPAVEAAPEVENEGVEVYSPLPVAEPAAGDDEGGPLALDLAQALELFEEGMAVFVDARMPDEFAAGHIPGAFNLPYDELESHLDVLNYLPDDGLVIIYCDGSECELSLELADELSAMGFGQVRVFFGGWEQWFEAGHPTEEGEAILPF